MRRRLTVIMVMLASIGAFTTRAAAQNPFTAEVTVLHIPGSTRVRARHERTSPFAKSDARFFTPRNTLLRLGPDQESLDHCGRRCIPPGALLVAYILPVCALLAPAGRAPRRP
jgi:hypothetical protein